MSFPTACLSHQTPPPQSCLAGPSRPDSQASSPVATTHRTQPLSAPPTATYPDDLLYQLQPPPRTLSRRLLPPSLEATQIPALHHQHVGPSPSVRAQSTQRHLMAMVPNGPQPLVNSCIPSLEVAGSLLRPPVNSLLHAVIAKRGRLPPTEPAAFFAPLTVPCLDLNRHLIRLHSTPLHKRQSLTQREFLGRTWHRQQTAPPDQSASGCSRHQPLADRRVGYACHLHGGARHRHRFGRPALHRGFALGFHR